MNPPALTPNSRRVLMALAQAGKPVKARDLADMVGFSSKASSANNIRKLERLGLAETTPAGYVLARGTAVFASGVIGRWWPI